MKRSMYLLLALALTCTSPAVAQEHGFGGNQQSQTVAQYAAKYADLNYADDGQAYHTLDVYIPKTPMPKKGYPVIVHIYGSAWFGNNGKGHADINTICAALLEAGYVVVCPNHRSSHDAQFPAQIQDIKAVIRWIRGNAAAYHFDSRFVGTSGFSSGAHLATLCATTNGIKTAQNGSASYDIEGQLGQYIFESSDVQACCEWSGPIDLMNMDCDGIAKKSPKPEDQLMGFAYPGHEEAYELLNPAHYLNKQTVPIRVCHGEKDNVVPFCQGKELYGMLKMVGVKGISCLWEAEGGHGHQMYSPQNLRAMVQHFDDARK